MSSWTESDDYTTATLERVTDHGVFRAVIERDDYPEAPYFFAGDPILDTESGTVVYGGETENGPSETVAAVVRAHRHLDCDVWERYVRAFHGGTVRWVDGGSRGEESRYAALALPAYRAANGCPSEHLHDPADVSEWTAYVEGDVYGIRVEQATAFDDDGEVASWTALEDTGVWGFYGEAVAKDAAEDALAVEIRETAASMLPLEVSA